MKTDKGYRARGVTAPEELRAKVADLVTRFGPTRAGHRLGMHREQVVALVAGVPVLQGTIALARERLLLEPVEAGTT